jgi:N-acetyl-gamma-glutamyl-phosphate reductase
MDKYSSPVRVAIAGATGYAGQELLSLLVRHPEVDLIAAMSSSPDSAARPLPRFARTWDGKLEPLDMARLKKDATFVFLAVPEAAAAELGPELLSAGVRVIDLSGAFRIRDEAQRAKWYPATTTQPANVAYGLVEHNRDAIKDAALVACPGCYPTAALLALTPLAQAGLIDPAAGIIVDAKSGISGAGRSPSDRTHFSENHGSMAAYGVLGHRHVAEMEQALGSEVTFVPHLVPLDRGILETIYVKTVAGTSAAQISDVLHHAYASAPFVRLTGDALPEIKHVAWTNFCDIGWKFDAATRRLVLIACIDNLVKGAAGQAVQNFNVICGFDERTGLR